MMPRALLLIGLAATLNAGAQTQLASENPFKAPANNAPAANAQGETIEFAGVSQMDDRIDLVFFDKAAKKSRWVPLKSTVEGIEALSYDAKTQEALVKINGTEKRLPLRKQSGPANAPGGVAPMHTGFSQPPQPPPAFTSAPVAPPPLPTAPVVTQPIPVQNAAPAANTPPATPEAQLQAKQEQEARMLVSDLLEIGMAQRKAYEEAQRKAQGGQQSAPAQK
jgi:hypothetical protein